MLSVTCLDSTDFLTLDPLDRGHRVKSALRASSGFGFAGLRTRRPLSRGRQL